MPVLRQQFPEARFVFLHGNGPDTALSMSRHPSYRLAALQMLAAAAGQPPDPQLPLPEEIRRARPEDFQGLAAPPFDRACASGTRAFDLLESEYSPAKALA